MLERNHLEILRAVDQYGTLTKASEILCITQSALSHAIKKLEHQLGTPVWRKEGRTLRLTQAGHQLLGLSMRVLPQFENMESLLLQYAEGLRGTLRIGMECHPCYRWLLSIVSPYLNACPHVEVDVKQRFQFKGIGALLAYEVDVLITPDPTQHSELVFMPALPYEQVLVVNNEHPLANRASITPGDLTEEVLITYPVARDRLDIFNQFLTPKQQAPKQHKVMESTDIMMQMVAAGRGVATLPKWLVSEYAETLPVMHVRLGEKGIHKNIHIGARKQDIDIPYVVEFVKLAQAAVYLSSN